MVTQPGDILLVALNEQSNSGQTGWAVLTAKGDQTEVTVTILPCALESELIHIHIAPCGASLGAVAYGLNNVAHGASVSTVDATLGSLLTGGFAINAHQKGNAGTYTACGNIPAAPATSTTPSAAGETSQATGGTDYGY